MSAWRNTSGRPLSTNEWLQTHHNAKLPERTRFAKTIASKNPKRIVDLGCGPAIWLDLLDKYLPNDCEFFGIDSDSSSLVVAREKAQDWGRQSTFIALNIDQQPEQIPQADLYLAFNIFPYIKNTALLLETLSKKLPPDGLVFVRQYDGGMLRIGPLPQVNRSEINNALQSATIKSEQFKHYDMDRVFEIISRSPLFSASISFETYSRIAPFDEPTERYIRGTIEWEKSLVSENARKILENWEQNQLGLAPAYFIGIDLVAELSLQ